MAVARAHRGGPMRPRLISSLLPAGGSPDGRMGAATDGSEAIDPSTVALTQRLTDWRRRLSRASGVPAHVLMHDSTVTAIALRKPASEEELLGVPGMGAIKVARFGPAILEVVQGGRG